MNRSTKPPLLLVFRLVQYIIGSVVVGTMAVTLTISFAALVYTGPLAPYLGRGANLVLIGAAVMAAVGTFSYSIRGSIANPQDVSAVLLGSAAVTIATTDTVAPDALFPTILALVAAACLVSGASAFLAGILRLGALVRYAPYPVTAGFLAATGYLLVMGGLSIVARESVTAFNLVGILSNLPLSRWLPWLAVGFVLAIITKRFPGDFTLPAALVLATFGFYTILFFQGISIDMALAQSLLLGPFDEADTVSIFEWQFIQKVEWGEIIRAAPTLAAVVGLTLLGSILNTTGLAIVVRETTDTERDMRATGLVNLASAPLGGLPGYVILGESILARRMGIVGHAPGLVTGFACACAAFAGVEYLAYAPAGLMAMVVFYLGFDLIGSWLVSSRQRLTSYEYAIVLLIVFITATFGFLEALALGTLAAAVIFVITYAKADVLRVRSSLAKRHSWVERSEEEMRHLTRVGHTCVVLELSGFLFFGTADKIAQLAKFEISSDSEIRYLVLDFSRVTGIDASASAALIEAVRLARSAGVDISFCSVSSELKRQIQRLVPRQEQPRINGQIDEELERIEDALLKEVFVDETQSVPRIIKVVQDFEKKFSDHPYIICRVSLQAGQELLASGNISDEIYVIRKGLFRVEVHDAEGCRRTVAKLRAGALVGEIAYYAGVPRSASAVAETDSEVLRIDLRQLEQCHSDLVLEFNKASSEIMARRIIRLTDQVRDLGLAPR